MVPIYQMYYKIKKIIKVPYAHVSVQQRIQKVVRVAVWQVTIFS